MAVSIRVIVFGTLGSLGAGPSAVAAPPATATCRVAIIKGEATAGQSFERPIGNGLRVLLEPIASGWILRVLPARGPRGEHDYAELATPPYRSVSPLLVGTDFSFRAQDALAWNPRHFRFAADNASFAKLQAAYNEVVRFSNSGPAGGEAARLASLHLAEARLSLLVADAPQADLSIIDARLVQGTGDQAPAAALVASHLNRSAHQVDQPADGRSTPLGRIDWLSFRIRLELPTGFRADPALAVERSGCL